MTLLKSGNLQKNTVHPATPDADLRYWVETLSPLFQTNPSALCITDRKTRVIYGNEAFENLLAGTPQAAYFINQKFWDLFPHSTRVTTKVEEYITEAKSGIVSKPLHHGNKTTPVNINIQPLINPSTYSEASPAKGEAASEAEDEAIGALVTINIDSDQQELLLAEEKQVLTSRIRQLSSDVIDKKSLIKILMEKSPFGITLMDRDRNVIQINRAAENILGLNRNNAIGMPCSSVFSCYEQNLGCPVLDGNKSIDQEESICVCQGTSSPMILRSAVLCRERNEDLVLEVFIDVTEIKGAQAAKEDAYQARNEFFAKMSHELRTPLNAIIGYSELIANDVDNITKGETVEFTGNIQRAGYDLLHLVDQVLDIAKLENSDIKSNPVDLNPRPVIDNVAALVRPLAEKNHNQFSINSGIKLGTIYADPDHLQQILLNLLGNACKFTRDGEVKLEVKQDIVDGITGISFLVHDTGIGLRKEEIERIFEKFEQADNSTTRRYGGSGLGLSIVKELCDVMSGTIQVESTPGKGSTFILWLPGQAGAVIPEEDSTSSR